MANINYNEKIKKYIEMYNILKEVKDDDKQSILSIDNQSSTLYSGLESTSWTEKGKNVIISDGVPYLKGALANINNSIDKNLLEANGILYDKVYPLLEDLNNLKGQYEESKAKTLIDTTDTVSIDDFNKVKTKIDEDIANVDNYLKEIDNLGKEVKTTATWMASGGTSRSSSTGTTKIDLVAYTGGSKSAEQIASLKNTHSILEAKGLSLSKPSTENIIREEYITNSGTNRAKTNTSTSSQSSNVKTTVVNKGNTYTFNGLDGSWTVAKTTQDLNNYLTKIKTGGVFQASNTSRYGDSCLAFAEVYGSNLMSGNTNNAEQAFKYCCAASYKNFFSDSQEETMRQVYNQIVAGKPVVIQVNGNSQGTCRHFVTVVGFKSSVTAPEKLTPKDLLIIDSWDGQLERMDTKSSRFLTTGAACHKNYSGYYLRILQ